MSAAHPIYCCHENPSVLHLSSRCEQTQQVGGEKYGYGYYSPRDTHNHEQFQYVPITNTRCINENKCTYAPIPFSIVNITSSPLSPLLSLYWTTALNLDRLFCSGIGTEDFLLHSLSIRFGYADTIIRYALVPKMVNTDYLATTPTYLRGGGRRRAASEAES